MVDVIQVIAKSIIAKLKTNTSLVNTLGATGNFWLNAAPPKIGATTFPYVQLLHTSGGVSNDAKYDSADVEFLIAGTALDSTGAETIANYIRDSLHKQVLTYSDGWRSWSTVRESDGYSRQVTIQQTQYNQSGAYYRFRLSKG